MTLLAALWLAAAPSSAADCARSIAEKKAALSAQFRMEEHRALTRRVQNALTAEESARISQMAELFNAIPHAGSGIGQRIELQKEARRITRQAARRAGLVPINPEEGSPYDAELGERRSPDGYTAYGVEVRTLLVRPDPLPHVTLWLRSSDPVHNPRLIVTVGVPADPAGDYVSWMTPGGRASAPLEAFVASGIPGCLR